MEAIFAMFKILKQTISEFSSDHCTQKAASLSYYTIFSLAPLLVIGIAISGLVFDADDVTARIEAEITGLVGTDGANQVTTMIQAADVSDKGTMATIISSALLLVGATGLVGQLQSAMNRTWEVAPDPKEGGIKNFLAKRVFSFGMLMGGAFLMLVSLLLSTAIAAFGEWIGSVLPGDVSTTLLRSINTLATLVVVFTLFAAMFKFLPDAKIAWSDVLVGAFCTAVMFVVGKFAMGAYLGSKNMDSTFGAAGSLALLLSWIYYTSIIFLLGAEFTQVWAKNWGSGVKPEEGAVRVVEKTLAKHTET